LNQILILASYVSAKLDYVCDYIFTQNFGVEYQLTQSESEFYINTSAFKLNYSQHATPSTLSILPTAYFSNFDRATIPDTPLDLELKEDHFSFDLFAAIFYLLARVEEYGCEALDEHGRFHCSQSILYKRNILDKPIIDIWLQSLREALENKSGVQLKEPKYTALSTIDVDHIYAYKGKSFPHRFATLTRDLLTLRWEKVKARNGPDPFDTFDKMISLNKAAGHHPLFFILTADRSKYDRSLPPTDPLFREKIKALSEGNELGIHPSYNSHDKPEGITMEVASLTLILNKPIYHSRQHYLKMTFPDTYRRLIEAGVEQEHSMGYPDRLGFRAGTSRSFFWYDLEADGVTKLRVVPFCCMDVTLRKYLELTPESAIESCTDLVSEIKAVSGHFSFIWHNSSFYAAEGWAGWEEVYQKLLEIARL